MVVPYTGDDISFCFCFNKYQWWFYMQTLVALHTSQDSHMTTLTCKNGIYTLAKKKNIYIYIYVRLNYLDHSNKKVEYPDLRITKSWVQKK